MLSIPQLYWYLNCYEQYIYLFTCKFICCLISNCKKSGDFFPSEGGGFFSSCEYAEVGGGCPSCENDDGVGGFPSNENNKGSVGCAS